MNDKITPDDKITADEASRVLQGVYALAVKEFDKKNKDQNKISTLVKWQERLEDSGHCPGVVEVSITMDAGGPLIVVYVSEQGAPIRAPGGYYIEAVEWEGLTAVIIMRPIK